MGKKDFDDLLHVINGELTLSVDVTTVSLELDLELPRGFIAKIHKVQFIIKKGIMVLVAAGHTESLWECALVRDPDDAVTFEFPLNDVQHDVIAEAKWTVNLNAQAAGDVFADFSNTTQSQVDFTTNELDVITARNLRFNGVKQDLATPVNTTPELRVNVFYTLEKVTDADILELLDIL